MAALAETLVDRPKLRGFMELGNLPELPKSQLVVCSDVEGPWFTKDPIADAMIQRIRPNDTAKDLPPYGKEIYENIWEWFSQDTVPFRKGNIPNPTLGSVSQETEDTLFTMPLFLAFGVDEQYLRDLTQGSRPTPGALELLAKGQKEGLLFFGLTGAPQEFYRNLVATHHALDPRQLFGSPFPLQQLEDHLKETGQYEEEVGMARSFAEDCFEIIDEHSDIKINSGNCERILSEDGKKALQGRAATFFSQELGITYDFMDRKAERVRTETAAFIEGHRVLGDRSKAAFARVLARKYVKPDGACIAQGDGVNDIPMLCQAQISIGYNSPDAAKGAKIGVITPNVTDTWPIYEAVLEGARSIKDILEYAKPRVGSQTIIHEGGESIPDDLLLAHREMKRKIRGENLVY